MLESIEIYFTLNIIQIGGLGIIVYLVADLRSRIKRLEDLHLSNK